MGRHSRTSTPAAPAASEPGRHRGLRRRHSWLRAGLMLCTAVLTPGAVAVGAGLLPPPWGIPAALNPPRGNAGHVQAAPSHPTLPPRTGMPGGARPSAPTGRGTSRGPLHHQPSHRPAPPAPKPPAARGFRHSPAPRPKPARTPVSQPTPGQGHSTSAPPANKDRPEQAEVLSLVNDQRTKAGCAPLKDDPRLDALAGSFSDEMAERGFFGHTAPDGRTQWDQAKAAGITNLGGENIARGQATAQAVMNAWMNSPRRRAHILDCRFHTLGVGVHHGTGGPWWTEDFGY
jgi:uncharacterized protein YkwD